MCICSHHSAQGRKETNHGEHNRTELKIIRTPNFLTVDVSGHWSKGPVAEIAGVLEVVLVKT